MHKVHAVLLLLLAPFPLAAVSPVPKIKPQIRALWVDAFHAGIRTPEEADKLVADALAAHLNLLVVQVRRRGDAYYTKSLEPPPDDPDYKPGFDSLGYILEKAHAAGLKVHAWMNVTPVWRSLRIPPSDPAHIFRTHGPSDDRPESWNWRAVNGETARRGRICSAKLHLQQIPAGLRIEGDEVALTVSGEHQSSGGRKHSSPRVRELLELPSHRSRFGIHSANG